MSIISWTSPSPSARILPISSETSRPSGSLCSRSSFAQLADDLAALRRRHHAPGLEAPPRAACDDLLVVLGRRLRAPRRSARRSSGCRRPVPSPRSGSRFRCRRRGSTGWTPSALEQFLRHEASAACRGSIDRARHDGRPPRLPTIQSLRRRNAQNAALYQNPGERQETGRRINDPFGSGYPAGRRPAPHGLFGGSR